MIRIAHLVDGWLPYSQTWIHEQVVGPTGVVASVVAVRAVEDGPVRFPVADLATLATGAPRGARLVLGLGLRPRALLTALLLPRLRALAPDVVHAHFGHTAWRYLPAVRALGIPLVTSFYGYDMSELPQAHPVWRPRYGELFAHGTLFLCEGPVMAREVARLGCPPEKIRVQRLGINVERFLYEPRIVEAGTALRVLAAAGFKEKKGLPDAVAAVALAAREADVRLTIVGDRGRSLASRKEKRRILAAIAAHRAGGRVTLAGKLAHEALARIAYAHHVVLQPSKRSSAGDTEGGAPVGLVELAATGLACVATRHADIPEVVEDGVTGLLADEGDVAALARHLVLLAREPARVTALGRAAAAHVRRRFDRGAAHAALAACYAEAARHR